MPLQKRIESALIYDLEIELFTNVGYLTNDLQVATYLTVNHVVTGFETTLLSTVA